MMNDSRNEYLDDKENNIIRPRQDYQGKTTRDYVEMNDRKEFPIYIDSTKSSRQKRRETANVEWKIVPNINKIYYSFSSFF